VSILLHIHDIADLIQMLYNVVCGGGTGEHGDTL
jgi:hypothetical protein